MFSILLRPQRHTVVRLRFCSSPPKDSLPVVGYGGDYHLSVPYPGRTVRFPLADTDLVKNLRVNLQVTDPSVHTVNILTKDRVRVSGSTNIHDLFQDTFILCVNDKEFLIKPPKNIGFLSTITPEDTKFQEVRNYLIECEATSDTVSRASFVEKCENVGIPEEQVDNVLSMLSDMGHILHVRKNIELHDVIFLKPGSITNVLETALDIEAIRMSYKERSEALEKLKAELAPLQVAYDTYHSKAESSASRISSGVLIGLTFQFFLFARLTWWDSDWDVMEPITWFTTIWETVIASYGWYLWTGREYAHMSFWDMLVSMRLKREIKRHRFDIARFEVLKETIADLEMEVKHLPNE